ncbi:hypothetical protein FKM82_010708 [Ascaphus truei]
MMNLQTILLYLAACISFSVGNRVYIHPFNLYAYDKSQCVKIEKQNDTTNIEKMITPIAIESKIVPKVENLQGRISLETKQVEIEESGKLRYLTSLVNDLGFRTFNAWRKTHKVDTVLMSNTNLFGSLLSFYLGASKHTSTDLQKLLGFEDPLGNCSPRVDGLKVFSTLKTIDNLLFSKDDNIDASKMACMFVSTGVPLSEMFVHNLVPSADEFYVSAVDFRNPLRAIDAINEFLKARSFKISRYALTSVDASTNLLFTSYVYFKGKVKNSFIVPEPQDFWIEPNKKISVPMMSLCGMFQFKSDNDQSILRIPLSENDFLLLIQPNNGNTLENLESSFSMHSFSTWLNNLANRYISVSMPTLEIESSYDIQETLSTMELSSLLGKNADFSKISNVDLIVGKVINKIHFELKDGGIETNQAEDFSPNKNDMKPLEVKYDKPFLLVIFEGTTKALLYIGRVTNPVNVA